MKVLIVEDEAVVATNYRVFLERNGLEVVGIATTGAKAIEIAEQTRPDIVIMDIVLRGPMNGIEAASRIIELCNSRVIYVTGNRQFQHDPNVLHTDPVAFLIKPVRERRLLELIRSAESS